MQQQIDQLSDHFIVCGFGRVGEHVVEDLESRGQRCVIIESDPQVADRLTAQLVVCGDAADDEILLRAGVGRARGLVAAS